MNTNVEFSNFETVPIFKYVIYGIFGCHGDDKNMNMSNTARLHNVCLPLINNTLFISAKFSQSYLKQLCAVCFVFYFYLFMISIFVLQGEAGARGPEGNAGAPGYIVSILSNFSKFMKKMFIH